jgi:NADH:ubiquinone oxidoreductase subunit 3 (subunit A)
MMMMMIMIVVMMMMIMIMIIIIIIIIIIQKQLLPTTKNTIQKHRRTSGRKATHSRDTITVTIIHKYNIQHTTSADSNTAVK